VTHSYLLQNQRATQRIRANVTNLQNATVGAWDLHICAMTHSYKCAMTHSHVYNDEFNFTPHYYPFVLFTTELERNSTNPRKCDGGGMGSVLGNAVLMAGVCVCVCVCMCVYVFVCVSA